jgi:hypothetical protein
MSAQPFPDALDALLTTIREKARIIKILDDLLRNTEGNVRDGYRAVVENELYAMMRLIDDFKLAVCNTLSEVNHNALFRGSIFPVNGSN